MASLERVSAEQARKLQLDGYALIDVRTEAEYASGHPVDAYNVPFMLSGAAGMQPNNRFLTVMCTLFDMAEPLLLSCASGNRSAYAAQQLMDAGFARVVDVRPGYSGARNAFGQVTHTGWRDAGLPTELTTDGRDYAELLAKTDLAAAD